MIKSCNTIVNRRDRVQYLTVSKSYSDNCTCSLTEQNTTLKNHFSVHFKNSEYDQEIPQSQTADNPMAPRGRAAQPSQDSRKTN